jgi:hypothetical protein
VSESDRVFKPVFAFALAATSILGIGVNATESVPSTTIVIGTTYERRETTDNLAGTSTYLISTSWARYVNQRLIELGEGQFDFTGLQIPSAATIDRARSIAFETLRDDTPTPSVVPSEDGAVLMVWRRSGWDVEFRVTESDADIWARRRADSTEWYGPFSQYLKEFSSLLDELSTV